MPNERPIITPGPPDLVSRLPTLDQAALNQGTDHLPLEEGHARRRNLTTAVLGIILTPWAAWKVVDLGWLGWMDAIPLTLAAEAVAVIGMGFAVVPYRAQFIQERLRARRAQLETNLVQEGYQVLFN